MSHKKSNINKLPNNISKKLRKNDPILELNDRLSSSTLAAEQPTIQQTSSNNINNSSRQSRSNDLSSQDNISTFTSAGADLTARVVDSLSTMANKIVEQNVAISQNLLNCRNMQDIVNVQQQIFESSFNNLMKLHTDIGAATQDFSAECLNDSSKYIYNRVKCHGGEMI